MKILKFKTNINCSGCVSKVTPFLVKQEGITSWEVDTNDPHKILTVASNTATEEDVKMTLQKIGFTAEKMAVS